jgi:DTW domain-containing protein YfiP
MSKRTYCDRCNRPSQVCFCQNISLLDNHWPISIIQFYKEKKHPLGTITIAKLGLSNCQVILSDDPNYNDMRENLIKQQPLLVYPGENSIPLEPLAEDVLRNENLSTSEKRPILFLDGTWRKTRRLLHESPELDKLTKISIQPDMHSRYRIRKAPNPQALSTLEAIVYVLSLLEKDSNKYQSLLDAMDLMINKQIEMMGNETFKQNY